ncbi:MFS transporter [Rhodococcus zopfii]
MATSLVVENETSSPRGLPIGFHLFSMLAGLSLGLTAPLTAGFAVALGSSAFQAGLSVASLTAVVFVMDIFGTRLLPYIEARRSICFGMALWSIGSFGSALSPNMPIMASFRLLQGLGLAFFASAAPQAAVAMAGPGNVGKALGRFTACMALGSVVGPLGGGALAAIGTGDTGLRIAFHVCGVLAAICAISVWWVIPEHGAGFPSMERPRLSLPRLPGILRPRSLMGLGLGATGQGVRSALAITLLPLVAVEDFGLSSVGIGVVLSCMFLLEVVIMSVGGAASDRRGRRPILTASSILGVGAVMAGVAALFLESVPLFIGAVIVLGVACGGMMSLPPAMAVDLASSPQVGLASYRISKDFGFTFYTVLIGGAIGAMGSAAALALCAVCFAVVLVLALAVGETLPPRT